MRDVLLLDCTLRDGGYINNWKWGYHNACSIVDFLTRAGVDVVEVGFLRNTDEHSADITVSENIEELNRFLPAITGDTIYSAMAMQSNYDVNKLPSYSGSGIQMIRVTAHDYDIEEGMVFAQKVKEKGYKVSINPINIMGYSDEMILKIVDKVNKIQPYQFSIVDTFGSMRRRDLDRIVSLIDNNLSRNIRLALHLHENMSLGTSLAQQFVDKHLLRPIAIDASLLGMGRIPGNLPIELIADYLNDYCDKDYDIDYMLDAIQDYVAPLKGSSEWGYMPAFFLSARHNLHRNYAEYYLNKGDLTNSDINQILSGFDKNKTTVFDENYAEDKYTEYKNNTIDDSISIRELTEKLKGRKIVVLAPGSSLSEYKDKINSFILENNALTIAVNFIPEMIPTNLAFFSNNKRKNQIGKGKLGCDLIITSNINDLDAKYVINYNRLSKSFGLGYNSLVMLLALLKETNATEIFLAGADGFKDDRNNYYKSSITNSNIFSGEYNLSVTLAIKKIGLNVYYLTPSEYNK